MNALDGILPVAPAGFSWSASRAGIFEDCPRAYFFQYYVATGKAIDVDAADVAEAQRLKQLTSLPLWIGSRVHDTIERLLRAARNGVLLDVEKVLEQAVQEMRRDYVSSVRDLARTTRDYRAHARFHEHEYGREVARETWAERVDEARRMLRAFARHGYRERVRDNASRVRALENLVDWPFESARVYLKIDLAYEDGPGTVHVLDWKTGWIERGDTPLQMMAYALHAMSAWGVPRERLDVREVWLRQDDPERPCRIDDPALESGRERMRASIGAMLAALDDPSRDAARAERFEPRPDARRCGSCNFLRLCGVGRTTPEVP